MSLHADPGRTPSHTEPGHATPTDPGRPDPGSTPSRTEPRRSTHPEPDRTAHPARPTRRLSVLRPWLSTFALLALWQALAGTGILDPRTLPAPSTLARVAAGMVADGSLVGALGVSLARVAAGTVIGTALGLALGLASGLSRLARDVVDRPMQAIRAVPFTALTPLLILWLGLGEAPKIVLVAIAVVVPVYLNTMSGVRGVDRRLLLVARACRLTRGQTVRHVILPGAAPAILVGLRFALGVAWVAVIVAETVNAASGIGFLLAHARTFGRTDVVMVCIVVYAALGLLTDLAVRALEARVLRWRPPLTGDPS